MNDIATLAEIIEELRDPFCDRSESLRRRGLDEASFRAMRERLVGQMEREVAAGPSPLVRSFKEAYTHALAGGAKSLDMSIEIPGRAFLSTEKQPWRREARQVALVVDGEAPPLGKPAAVAEVGSHAAPVSSRSPLDETSELRLGDIRPALPFQAGVAGAAIGRPVQQQAPSAPVPSSESHLDETSELRLGDLRKAALPFKGGAVASMPESDSPGAGAIEVQTPLPPKAAVPFATAVTAKPPEHELDGTIEMQSPLRKK